MRHILTKLTLFVVLLIALAGTYALAQAPPPTGKWMKDEENPVLEAGAALDWDSGAVFAPGVLADQGSFQMYYTGKVATGTAIVPVAIGRATSPNGTGWTKDADNPLVTGGSPGEWDAAGVEDPVALIVDGTYHLWYAGRSAGGSSQIGHATSPDGVNWTKDEGNPVLEAGPEGTWDTRGVRPGSVIRVDGEYRMWYTGANVHGTAQIGYATSDDGTTWAKYAGNPVLQSGNLNWEASGVYRPAVVFDGTTYRMWYTGAGSDGAQGIGFATSSDGVAWDRDAENPVLGTGESGAWDAASVSQSAVIFEPQSSTYHLWYTGQAEDVRQIGHATANAGYAVYLPLISRSQQ